MAVKTDEDVTELARAVVAGNRRALARAITMLEDDGSTTRYSVSRPSASGHADARTPVHGRSDAGALIDALSPYLTGIQVIGVTGPPGAGKSTLVNALIREWRRAGKRVSVVAVDPSSPTSGGAILGDRIRMSAGLDDEGVYIRSLASQGHLGGISPAAVRVIDAFDAAGFDILLLETVGTGQNEIDVAAVADVAVVTVAPGLGDGIQAMKAGLLDVADILVVNKSDRPDAAMTAEQLMSAVQLRQGNGRMPNILQTTATTGDGVARLAGEIERCAAAHHARLQLFQRRHARARYVIERVAIARLCQALDAADGPARELIDDVANGHIAPVTAARRLLDML